MIWIFWTSGCLTKRTVRESFFLTNDWDPSGLAICNSTTKLILCKSSGLPSAILEKRIIQHNVFSANDVGHADCHVSGKKDGYFWPNLSITLQSIWNVLECDRRLHTWGGDLQQISTSWRQKVPTVIARERCDGQHWHPSNLCCHIGHIFSHWSNRSQR